MFSLRLLRAELGEGVGLSEDDFWGVECDLKHVHIDVLPHECTTNDDSLMHAYLLSELRDGVEVRCRFEALQDEHDPIMYCLLSLRHDDEQIAQGKLDLMPLLHRPVYRAFRQDVKLLDQEGTEIAQLEVELTRISLAQSPKRKTKRANGGDIKSPGIGESASISTWSSNGNPGSSTSLSSHSSSNEGEPAFFSTHPPEENRTFDEVPDDQYQTDNSSEKGEDDDLAAFDGKAYLTDNSSEASNDDCLEKKVSELKADNSLEDDYKTTQSGGDPEENIRFPVMFPQREGMGFEQFNDKNRLDSSYGIDFERKQGKPKTKLYPCEKVPSTSKQRRPLPRNFPKPRARKHSDEKSKSDKKRSNGERNAEKFLARMDQISESKRNARNLQRQKIEYDACVDKKSCPECETVQSFDQVQKRQNRCNDCGKIFRRKIVWESVRDDFLGRQEVNDDRTKEGEQECERTPAPPCLPKKEFLERMGKAEVNRKRRIQEGEFNPKKALLPTNYSLYHSGKASVLPLPASNQEQQLESDPLNQLNYSKHEPHEVLRARKLIEDHLAHQCDCREQY